MVELAEPLPALARVEAGGVIRSVADDPRCRLSLDHAWGRVRAMQLCADPLDLPEGQLLNDVVALNLGAVTACEGSVARGAWETLQLPAHGVGLMPARVPHAARFHGPCEVLLVELRPDFVAAALGSAAGPGLVPQAPALDTFAAHVMLALAEEAQQASASGALRAERLGSALVTHLAERDALALAPAERVSALRSPQLRRVLDYVSFHLDAPLTLQRLAELAEMDVFRFVRAFKQSTGLSPHRYVLEARIARAQELLRDRSLSITEVALQTGFATPSHFSVTFRRITHLTPRAYRDGLGP